MISDRDMLPQRGGDFHENSCETGRSGVHLVLGWNQPRSRGFPRSGVGPSFRTGRWSESDSVTPVYGRSRSSALATGVLTLKRNCEKARERALTHLAELSVPAVNGGPLPLRGEPRERGYR